METAYLIKYYYHTGDSFTSVDKEDVLEFQWKNLDIAKECLRRIKEHYLWYQSIENYRFVEDKVDKPEWHNVKIERHFKSNEHCLLNLPMDNGNEIQFWPPWIGYFEMLYGAEIITSVDTDMKFEL